MPKKSTLLPNVQALDIPAQPESELKKWQQKMYERICYLKKQTSDDAKEEMRSLEEVLMVCRTRLSTMAQSSHQIAAATVADSLQQIVQMATGAQSQVTAMTEAMAVATAFSHLCLLALLPNKN